MRGEGGGTQADGHQRDPVESQHRGLRHDGLQRSAHVWRRLHHGFPRAEARRRRCSIRRRSIPCDGVRSPSQSVSIVDRRCILEAVLANEDAAAPGNIQPGSKSSAPTSEEFSASRSLSRFPTQRTARSRHLPFPYSREEVPIDGPSGKYRFLVTFEKGVAASGGESEFYVTDPADMPPVETEVAIWGNDPELARVADGARNQGAPLSAGQIERSPSDSRFLCSRRRRERRRPGATLPHESLKGPRLCSSRSMYSSRATIRWAGCRLREKGTWGWSASTRFHKCIRRMNGRRSIRSSTGCRAAV